MCLVDYEKAFDRVVWTKEMEILRNIGVDWKDRRLIIAQYMGQNAVVRVNGGNTEPCIIGRGVRQGCLLSPTIFNIYAEAIEREAIEDVDEGLKVGGQLLQTINFTDDQIVVADTERGLQRMMDKMTESVERTKDIDR